MPLARGQRLLILGVEVAESTEARYMTRRPTARRIALRPGRRARSAMHRAQRLDSAPGRSWKARGNRLPTAVPMRGPPYEARASPRPRSSAAEDVPFFAWTKIREATTRLLAVVDGNPGSSVAAQLATFAPYFLFRVDYFPSFFLGHFLLSISAWADRS